MVADKWQVQTAYYNVVYSDTTFKVLKERSVWKPRYQVKMCEHL